MITKEASLSPQERDRRHRARREAMAGAGYDVLLFASLGHVDDLITATSAVR